MSNTNEQTTKKKATVLFVGKGGARLKGGLPENTEIIGFSGV